MLPAARSSPGSILTSRCASRGILHNLGDKLFNRAATDLDLSLKKVISQKDKLIFHQKCVSTMPLRGREENENRYL